MSQFLAPDPSDRVLEIGTGSGYQTAVLSEMVARVFTIEIVDDLAARAATNLARLGYTNVQTRLGDGIRGWPEEAPFDGIIVTCAPEKVPEALVAQLKEGGRMVLPLGPVGRQQLVVLTKRNGAMQRRIIRAIRFPPMTGEIQKP
jgi:protein-L-isoaspartate(D-aspartate) O-methyltransferase